MYFDFEDHRPDTPSIPRPMSLREVVLITVNLHLVVLVAILLGPQIPFVKRIIEARQAEAEVAQQEEQRKLEEQRERPRFVFMQPRMERPGASSAARGDVRHRSAGAFGRARARSAQPAAVLARQHDRARRRRARPEAGAARRRGSRAAPAAASRRRLCPRPKAPTVLPDLRNRRRRSNTSSGILADAIKNVQKYAQKEGFVNLQGGQNQEFGPFINFDSKGVEFGPWIARFVAQVRRNWFIPMAAMTMRGHVVVTFNVHKDGRITDVTVAKPSPVDAFTLSARNAILATNPTLPLPPEYPDDKAFFTVTFFFNENPGAP